MPELPLDAAGPEPLAATWLRVVSRVPGLLRVMTLAALAWATLGPRGSMYIPGDAREGVAIVVALDVSESMGDPGLGGGRKLDAALEEILRFAGRRGDDRVGLVTFGSEALVRVPPTTDRGVFLDVVRTVRPGELGDGTAVGTALGLAANRLRAVEAVSRIIVLVTDGRSNAGALDPVTAARAAEALGQRVFVIEVQDDAGSGGLLTQVAVAGGGRHYRVVDREGLDDAYREIDSLEPSPFPTAGHTVEEPLSAGLLWLALGFLLAERGLRASPLGRVA